LEKNSQMMLPMSDMERMVLGCFENQLTTLDVSNNTALTNLSVTGNLITFLNLSNNPALTEIWCNNNQLEGLNLKNGNNPGIEILGIQDNPNLTCIQVDNQAFSETNWVGDDFQKDSWATFSENCNYSLNDFELYNLSYYPNPVNDVLHFSSNTTIENVTISNMIGQEINVSVSSDNENLDLSSLPSGNYFVKVTIEGISKTIKVVK